MVLVLKVMHKEREFIKREKEKKETEECLVHRKRGHIAEGNDYFLLLTRVVIMKDLCRQKRNFYLEQVSFDEEVGWK